MKCFLYFFVMAVMSSQILYAIDTEGEGRVSLYSAETNVTFANEGQAELGALLKGKTAAEQGTIIGKIKGVATVDELAKYLPKLTEKYIMSARRRMSTTINPTACASKCAVCGAQLSDTGTALTSAGSCIAACLEAGGKYRAAAQQCLNQIVDLHTPKIPPKKEPPKVVPPKEEPPKTPPKEPPQNPPVCSPPAGEPPNIKVVKESLVCPVPRSIFDDDFQIVTDYLEGKVGRFERLPLYARLITTGPQQQTAPQTGQRPLQGVGQPPIPQQPPQKEEKSGGLNIGALLSAGTKLITGDVKGAGQTLDTEARRSEQERQWRQYENMQRRQYGGSQTYGYPGYQARYQQGYQQPYPQTDQYGVTPGAIVPYGQPPAQYGQQPPYAGSELSQYQHPGQGYPSPYGTAPGAIVPYDQPPTQYGQQPPYAGSELSQYQYPEQGYPSPYGTTPGAIVPYDQPPAQYGQFTSQQSPYPQTGGNYPPQHYPEPQWGTGQQGYGEAYTDPQRRSPESSIFGRISEMFTGKSSRDVPPVGDYPPPQYPNQSEQYPLTSQQWDYDQPNPYEEQQQPFDPSQQIPVSSNTGQWSRPSQATGYPPQQQLYGQQYPSPDSTYEKTARYVGLAKSAAPVVSNLIP